jgi:hypothetical protein
VLGPAIIFSVSKLVTASVSSSAATSNSEDPFRPKEVGNNRLGVVLLKILLLGSSHKIPSVLQKV